MRKSVFRTVTHLKPGSSSPLKPITLLSSSVQQNTINRHKLNTGQIQVGSVCVCHTWVVLKWTPHFKKTELGLTLVFSRSWFWFQDHVGDLASQISEDQPEDFGLEVLGTLSNLTVPDLDWALVLEEFSDFLPFLQSRLSPGTSPRLTSVQALRSRETCRSCSLTFVFYL